jgi:hypothetical protein
MRTTVETPVRQRPHRSAATSVDLSISFLQAYSIALPLAFLTGTAVLALFTRLTGAGQEDFTAAVLVRDVADRVGCALL